MIAVVVNSNTSHSRQVDDSCETGGVINEFNRTLCTRVVHRTLRPVRSVQLCVWKNLESRGHFQQQ